MKNSQLSVIRALAEIKRAEVDQRAPLFCGLLREVEGIDVHFVPQEAEGHPVRNKEHRFGTLAPTGTDKVEPGLLESAAELLGCLLQSTEGEGSVSDNGPCSPVVMTQRQHRLLFERASVGILIFDNQGVIRECNPQIAKIFSHVEPRKLIGMSLLTDVKNEVVEQTVQLAIAGEDVHFEGWYRSVLSGNERYIRASSARIEQGLFLGIIEDLTQIKAFEHDLVASRDRLRSLFENMLEGFANHQLIRNASGRAVDYRFLEVNEAFVRMTGLGGESVLGRLVTEVLPQILDSRFDWVGTYSRVVETGEAVRFESFFEPIDRWYHIAAFRTGPEQFAVMTQDITARKKAEEELYQSAEKYRQLFEMESDALFLIDKESKRILEANRKAVELYGYSREDLLGLKNVDLSAQPEQTAHVVDIEKKHVAQRFHRKKDGTVFPVEITGSYFNQHGRRVHIAAVRDITERVRAEEDLRRSESVYRLLVENAPIGIFKSTPEGRFLAANPALAAIYGYDSPDDLLKIEDIGSTLYLDPGEREELKRLLQERGEVVGHEKRQRRRDGTIFWITSNLRAVRDEQGVVRLWEGFISDITANKEAELRLKMLTLDLEEQVKRRTYRVDVLSGLAQQLSTAMNFDELFELLTAHLDKVLPLDVAASMILSGDEWRLYVQSKRPLGEEVLGRITGDLEQVLPAERSGKIAFVQRFPEHTNGRGAVRELGSSFIVALQGEAEADAGFLLLGAERKNAFTLAQRDLLHSMAEQVSSSFQRIRVLIREEKARMAGLVEELPVGVALLTEVLVLSQANRAALGCLSRIELVTLNRPLPRALAAKVRKLLDASGAEEIVIEEPGSSILILQARKLEQGPLAGSILLIVEDVTEERQMEMRARMQDRLASVGQLAAGIAHDFNNLLTAIGGYGELIQMDTAADPVTRKRAGIIREQVSRAGVLIRQILDFSRKSIMTRQPLDLAKLVRETVSLLERTMPENIMISLQIQPDEYVVHGNSVSIQQVLTNLAVNSRQAMPKGGRISISLGRTVREFPTPKGGEQEWIVLRVADTGSGIPVSIRDRIFDPFFTTKGPGEGTGLGLAQVYGIVNQHGGMIEVESMEREGATMVILLPRRHQGEHCLLPDQPEVPLRGRGERILLVEDNLHVLQMGGELLRSLGYTVLLASCGRDACRLFKQSGGTIDLVITDLVMPEMGGAELIAALKEKGPDLPVIIWSGYPLGKSGEEIAGMGADDFILKPPDRLELARTIRTVLAKRR
jgi:two-component system, cell cycle sensor histidine kinase and response regulator CckA